MLSRFFLFSLIFILGFFVWSNVKTIATNPSKITFVAYGDMPYMINLSNGKTDDQILKEEIAPAIRNNDEVSFVIHVGDLSRPEYACSDSFLKQQKAFWENEIVKPVFYTPGDNDWTDCDRQELPNPQSELKRLEAIRRILFSKPKNLNPQWRYEVQSDLPENAIWWYGNVLFVTQHQVSTDNGRSEILIDNPEDAIAEVNKRDQANKNWLKHAFKIAKKKDAEAVVIATQLDPFGSPEGNKTALERCLNNPAYEGFCSQVQELSGKLDRPVLFLHGDTNAYCYDQPFSQEIAPKLWRLNAPGDFKYIDASLITIDPSNSDQPFQITGLLDGKAPPQICDYTY